mmetsp:Transcript_17511/g.43693  ORF Transcript_17511/g.43693 Transcript_17511/m.43693 type:complete len:96 (-) Transcript_17511:301-588(-)
MVYFRGTNKTRSTFDFHVWKEPKPHSHVKDCGRWLALHFWAMQNGSGMSLWFSSSLQNGNGTSRMSWPAHRLAPRRLVNPSPKRFIVTVSFKDLR